MVIAIWIIAIFGGSIFAFVIGWSAAGMRGGDLDALGSMLVCGTFCAIAWIALLFWLSPLSITLH